jgi:hypothetical protein
MINRFTRTIYLVMATSFIFTGCQHNQIKDEYVLDHEPNLATINVSSDHAAGAIESAGGLDSWRKATKLKLSCIVTFYHSDGSSYLTQQQYNVYPWSNSIEIFGEEPQNNFSWRLSQGRFEVLQGSGHIINSANIVDNQCFAEAIISIVTAPIRLLDQSVEFTKSGNPIKIQGQWYNPLERHRSANIESILRIPKAVFYQNRDNLLIDMIWIACLGRNQFLTVRGYDYHEIDEKGLTIPKRIEIFSTDPRGNLLKRLVKIDIK